MSQKESQLSEKDTRLTGFWATGFPKLAMGFGGLGLLLAFLLIQRHNHHFFYSYLTSYMYFLSLSLGGMFFVLMAYLTRAGWSVAIRRVPEALMKNIVVMLVLFIPIVLGLHELYHWTHHDEVAKDVILQSKSPYLNTLFFLIRAAFFFACWLFIGHFFYKWSIAQDRSKDKSITLHLQRYATIGTLIFALTLTFAAIDWMMSLTPHWYSTIYGVYFFAGSAVSSLCAISLVFLILRKGGFLRNVLTLGHFHDLGKLIYGFMIFWAYISFSQYFLIWYANIPEETVFYLARIQGSWNVMGIFLVIGHFALPLIFFISRHARRNLITHGITVIWLLAMHYVDLYWMIMPTVNPEGIHFSLLDVACFIGIGGIFLGALFSRLQKHSLIPIGDPRLNESLNHETL